MFGILCWKGNNWQCSDTKLAFICCLWQILPVKLLVLYPLSPLCPLLLLSPCYPHIYAGLPYIANFLSAFSSQFLQLGVVATNFEPNYVSAVLCAYNARTTQGQIGRWPRVWMWVSSLDAGALKLQPNATNIAINKYLLSIKQWS